MSTVRLKNVFKSYDETKVIHGVSLEIKDGEFIVFVGPSGCGKSTLMRMVAGLEDITDGEIYIDDRLVNDLDPRDRDIAMVFQDYALYPTKTVFENMAFGLRLRHHAEEIIKTAVNAAADTLQLGALLERLPKALSGGQRQRVAMGRAIVRNPKVFLFDEPLSNLDALLRNQVRAEIKKLHQRLRGTIIYVTHDQVEAMTLADRIVVLRAGLIVQIGTPDEIYHQPQHRFVAGFTGSPPMNFIDARLIETEENIQLHLNETQKIPLSEQLAASLLADNPNKNRAIEFGIRPENLRLKNAETPTDWSYLALPVELIEPMGAENLIHFTLGNQSLIGRFAHTIRPKIGSALEIAFDPAQFHFFDPESGVSLLNKPA